MDPLGRKGPMPAVCSVAALGTWIPVRIAPHLGSGTIPMPVTAVSAFA